MTTIDWNNKVLCVAGVPSGGTSAVAGVLHHLGVNMGTCPTYADRVASKGSNLSRNYDTFEASGRKGLTFPEYAKLRLQTPGLNAWKGSSWRIKPGDFLSNNLPVEFLAVTRSLNATFESAKRYNHKMDFGSLIRKLKVLYKIHSPLLTVNYEELILDPPVVIKDIILTLGLNPTHEQHNAAIEFIDVDKCKQTIGEF